MFLRFVTHIQHPVSRHELGIFQAAWKIRRSGILTADEIAELDSMLDWFNSHLRVPRKFTRYRNSRGRRRLALCWFKPDATDHVRRMWKVARFLRQRGVPVKMIFTRQPGYIAYEDDLQIAAEPFNDTFIK